MWFFAPLFLRARVAIYRPDGRVLLVKHSFGADTWMLPGGGVKFGESPKEAAMREVYEELSLDVQVVEPLHEGTRIMNVSGLLFRVILFKSLVTDTDISSIKPSYEIREIRWFKPTAREVGRALPSDISL